MAFSYQKENDSSFHVFYRISYVVVVAFGLVGLAILFLSFDLDLNFGMFEIVLDNFVDILIIVVPLALAALIVGWLQVAITSKLGEEVILLVMWLTPFMVIGASAYLYLDSNDPNLLGGAAAGLVFLGLVYYFRRSVRLSARLIEVGAEITLSNPSLFKPQLYAFISTSIVTILMLPGVVTIFAMGARINAILGFVLLFIYEIMYFFVLSTIRSFADATNLAYINQWYSGKPNYSKSKDKVRLLRAPIVKYAFLMAFINRFRSNKQSGFTPFSLFKWMDFRNWPKLIFSSRRGGSALAEVAAYFGSYSLVVIVVKNMGSVSLAYKESAKSVFKNFTANIAGSIGFNILENLRLWISALLLLGFGGYYGYSVYGDVIIAIIIALLFLILGITPLNAMFKPVVNAYRLLLYRSSTGSSSSKLDKKTKEIIKLAIK